jgi:acyl-CoA oxidase
MKIGEIGAKYGFVAKDNGYIRFDKVRIPRENMLMRYAKVSRNGDYSRLGDVRISYATMLFTRAFLTWISGITIAKAAAIVVKYSHFRSQFVSEGKETTLILYQLQKEKIYPHIAETFAFIFGSQELESMCSRNLALINEENDFRMLNDCHALSSGLKAVYSWVNSVAIERMRRACGGHGFSSYSGLPSIIENVSPGTTYEGDNTVLMLQLGRYLLKSMDRASKNKPISAMVSYLAKQPSLALESREQLTADSLLSLFEVESYERLSRAALKLMAGAAQGLPQIKVWNRQAGISIVEAGVAHISGWTFKVFKQRVEGLPARLRAILHPVLMLYGCHTLLSLNLCNKTMRHEAIGWLQEAKEQLLDEVGRSDLLLVQAFHMGDNILGSAIAR